MNTDNKGNTIAMVLIIATAAATVTFSTMQLVLGESRRTKKAYVYHEARLAAESLLQCAFAELHDRYSSSNGGTVAAFPVDALSPARNPLGVPSEFAAEHDLDGRNVVLPQTRTYTSTGDYGSEPTELIGGRIPPGEWVFVDPSVPGNEFDQLAGTLAYVRGIEILAKASVDHPTWGDSTAYTRQILEIRDAPLFTYAIFYNVPMEIAPGPQMDVFGKVHGNGDLWLQSNGGLYFHEKVTSAGDILHGRHPDSGEADSDGAVRVANGSGDMVSLFEDDSWEPEASDAFAGGWLESSDADWRDLSTQLWDGNLQSKEHDVISQNPVGVTDYVVDTAPDTAAKESFNAGYSIIQPVVNRNNGLSLPDPVDDPSGYRAAKARREVEKQKYAYKAGLTVEVANDGSLRYITYQREADGSLRYDLAGNPVAVELQPAKPVANAEFFSSTGTGSEERVVGGMHDAREASDLNMVELDIAALKDLVHGESNGGTGDGSNADDWGGDSAQRPDEWWNGVVYVEFPQQYATSNREDGVNPAIEGWGLKVVNGSVIPNPEFAIAKDNYGLSIATNEPMYIQGDFNADGDFGTGSPTEADDGAFGSQDAEAPAALIADAITFLSNSWDDALSTQSKSQRNATDTEISAAILTGLVASGREGSANYSGGVENFPRFLETWSGDQLRIRGSMVALFDSEVATAPWGGSYYSPPQRLWGFHEKFGEGFLPPGTPNTRTFRGRDYQELSATEYAAHLTRLKGEFN